MRGRKKSTIFHHAVKIFFLLNCVMTVSCSKRKLTSFGTLGTIQFEAGDTILVPCIPVAGRFTFPYHAFFAVSDEKLFSVHASKSKWNETRPIITKRGDLKDDMKLLKAKVVKPDLSSDRKLLDLNAKAIPLAYRMTKTDLPYNLFNCNCRHYCDFLTYGKTYGTYLNPGYLPMSKRCPLANAIEIRDGKFQLEDKKHRTYNLHGPRWLGPKKDHVLKVEHPEHTSTADKLRHDPDSVLKVKEHHEHTSTADNKLRHNPDSVLKVKEHHEHTSTADNKLRHDPDSVPKGKGKVRGHQTLHDLFKESH
nr:PREDICTED: uncharacterized protein LOC109033180 [Bemisia tabaci]